MIKSVILKNCETKYKTLAISKFELFHNVVNPGPVNLMSVMPGQNDTDSGREGDEIVTQGMRIRLMFGSKQDRPNVTYRIFITSFDNYETDGFPDGSKFFHDVTGNKLLDPVQYKRFKILKSFLLRSKGTSMEVGESGKEYVRTLNFWLKLRRKMKFRNDATNIVTNYPRDLHLVVVAYDAYGTLVTDNIAYCQGACTLYYKDP